MSHQAAWLNTKNATLEVGPAETPTPGPNEILARVNVIAFSPFEAKIQRYEVIPTSYPNILGVSFAGTVEKVGVNVNGFQPGDRIVADRPGAKYNDSRFGAFQQYALVSDVGTSRLQPETTLEAGAATIANLGTIVSALSVYQGLDRPDPKREASANDKKVLLYGGSSSCGGIAIRYAKAAGYTVITTSSPRNRDYVASLGPDVIIDHTQPEGALVGELQAHGPYTAILDNIGLPAVDDILGSYLSSIGGGKYNTLIPVLPGGRPIPDNVEREYQSYPRIFADPKHEELRIWYYKKFLPESLASGIIVPTPQQWIKGGLKGAQKALDMLAEGKVSAVKLVMDPWEE